MKEQAEREERKEPRRDLLLILLIIPLGICCMFVAGQAAIELAPTWDVEADMGSNLDPNVEFSVDTISELIEPVSSNILTQPVWGDLFLTPNAVIPTRIIPTNIPTLPPRPTAQPTVVIPTNIPTSVPTPTTIVLPPPTKPPPPPTPPPPTPVPRADLSITKDDGIALYMQGITVRYTIAASNAGPDGVAGAIVTDTFDTTRLSNITWSCSGVGGASCTANGTSDISDIVNLPVGSTITYIVDADVSSTASGDLVNTASISHASVADPNTGNNSATDTNDMEPDIGPPDGNFYGLGDGNSIILNLVTPIIVDGNTDDDIVYYELIANPTAPLPIQEVYMDWIQVEISTNQVTWYTVFFWGDALGLPDTNTNVDTNIIGGTEVDNRVLLAVDLYPPPGGAGVTIDVDNPNGPAPPNGNYFYIRLSAPPGGGNDGATVDAVEILP